MGTPTNQNDSRALIASGGSYVGGCVEDERKIATADATATVIWSSPVIAVGQSVVCRALVVGKKDDGTAAAGNNLWVTFRRQSAGNVVIVGTAQGTTQTNGVTPVIAFAANVTDQTVELKVTGIAAETWNWEVKVDSIVI